MERSGDLILAQGSYIFVQDGASGQVEVLVGPLKQSLADTDKPVTYDHVSRKYVISVAEDAKVICPVADEGQYLVLSNPEKESNTHPTKGKQSVPSSGLNVGNKINIPGPCTFPLWPGQHCEVIDGHQLKSNEYLVIRVYNDKSAKENLSKAIVKSVSGEEEKSEAIFKEGEIITGKLFIIKGTDVSFYIPPTGIEVIKDDSGKYVRNAVTLESLEYCILLDQNGEKRYVEGPAVVFPKPTEDFVTSGESSKIKFKALELNDNMGIYIKVISDYNDPPKEYKAGDELFITGKEKKIYFPRAEHAIVKYGNDMIHYSTAIPNGEGRYVLDKNTGEISLKKGPNMFLADPRTQVLVKRILDKKTVSLWFPGNEDALKYNLSLQEAASKAGITVDYMETESLDNRKRKSSAVFSAIADELQRSNSYTKPRAITLDTKYEGAVIINIWPGYAVQVVKKTGERRVEVGPKTILLEYDETLEVLELSTGKPKTDHDLLNTVYLLTENNIVSDIVSAVTKDLVDVEIRLTYRVNFMDKDIKKWFSVSNYVKLLTQHMRSVIRNHIKKLEIETFNNSATDILRDLILGESVEGKRPGKSFNENGMIIYDVEILNVVIMNKEISNMLNNTQHNIVQLSLDLKKKSEELNYVKITESIERDKLSEISSTKSHKSSLDLAQIEEQKLIDMAKLSVEQEKQNVLNDINNQELNRAKSKSELKIEFDRKESEIRINESKQKSESIQPGLIEAITAIGALENNRILAENLKAQGGGLSNLFQKGGIDGLLEAVKGTPLEKAIKKYFTKD